MKMQMHETQDMQHTRPALHAQSTPHAQPPGRGERASEPPELFRRFAQRTSAATGSARAFTLAVLVIIVWAATGPLFHFSDAWQLVINTGTTIVTFLMVFLIQATQNRDTRAVHLKLDELLRAVEAARTSMVELEDPRTSSSTGFVRSSGSCARTPISRRRGWMRARRSGVRRGGGWGIECGDRVMIRRYVRRTDLFTLPPST